MPTTCGVIQLGAWPERPIGEDTAVDVRFGCDLGAVPAVLAQLSGVDAASPNPKRIEVWSSDESPLGFRLHARTWGSASVYGVAVSWIATTEHSLVQLGSLTLRPADGSAAELAAAEFPLPFPCEPDVVYGLSLLHLRSGAPVRLLLEDLMPQPTLGCGVRRVEALEDELVEARVAWVASSSPEVLQCGALEVGAQGEPIATGIAQVTEVFFRHAFDSTPGVTVAIAGLDASVTNCTRVKVWAEDATPEGFKLHVLTWSDSITYRVRVTWAATRSTCDATVTDLPPHLPPSQFTVDGPSFWGFCGVTHRARSNADGKIYAVKTSRYPFRENERALKQELQNLARLPIHDNVLRYHECVLASDRLHIVTEYIDSVRFLDLLPGPDGNFEQPHAAPALLGWMSQLFDGLAAVHSVGLVHRDLHSENVLVARSASGEPSQGPGSVRIIDFGAAGFHGLPGSGAIAPRLASQQVGWPQYFSPERKAGSVFDDRDDVWAAGCLLAEIASGRRIRRLDGCGADGADFSTTPGAVGRLILSCAEAPCRELACALLVVGRDQRPCATAAGGHARRLLGAPAPVVAQAPLAPPWSALQSGHPPSTRPSCRRLATPYSRLVCAEPELHAQPFPQF